MRINKKVRLLEIIKVYHRRSKPRVASDSEKAESPASSNISEVTFQNVEGGQPEPENVHDFDRILQELEVQSPDGVVEHERPRQAKYQADYLTRREPITLYDSV